VRCSHRDTVAVVPPVSCPLLVPRTYIGGEGRSSASLCDRGRTLCDSYFQAGQAAITIGAERLESSSFLSWRRSEAEVVDLLICRQDAFEELHGGLVKWPNPALVCTVNFSSGCDVFPVYAGDGPQTIHTEGLDDTYYFLIRNCASPSGREDDKRYAQYRVRLDYVYSNKDGSQLSCEYSGFPQLYLILSAVWLGTVVVWMAALSWRYQHSVALQRLLTAVPLMQVVRNFVNHRLWQDTQQTGERNNPLAFLQYLCNALYLSALFTSLLTLSKGFMILHWDSSLMERRTLLICMCWMVVTSLAYDLLGGFFVFMLVLVIRELSASHFSVDASPQLLLCTLVRCPSPIAPPPSPFPLSPVSHVLTCSFLWQSLYCASSSYP
jgi:hypothetical protein